MVAVIPALMMFVTLLSACCPSGLAIIISQATDNNPTIDQISIHLNGQFNSPTDCYKSTPNI